MSYSTTQIRGKDGSMISLPYRDVHDIRAQIMAEDATTEGSEDSSVIGLSTDDITPYVYEGGFKTWECSEDLAAHMFSMLSAKFNALKAEHHIVEVNFRFLCFAPVIKQN